MPAPIVIFGCAAAAGLTPATFRLRERLWPSAISLPHGALAVTGLTGLLDSLALSARADVTRSVNLHMLGIASAPTCHGLSLASRGVPWPPERAAQAWLTAGTAALGAACQIWGGHLGARLVYRSGAGRSPGP